MIENQLPFIAPVTVAPQQCQLPVAWCQIQKNLKKVNFVNNFADTTTRPLATEALEKIFPH